MRYTEQSAFLNEIEITQLTINYIKYGKQRIIQ